MPTNSRFLLTFATVVSFAVLCDALIAATPANRPPNFVFIMADDLGYGDIGVYGQARIRTPHVDRLAAEGTRFTSYYAGAAVCAPTRCCVMTGKHTGHGRIRNNHGSLPDKPQANGRIPLQPEDVTVAEVLKAAGYATGMVGKWGLGEEGTQGTPGRQGFDTWLGYLNQDHAEDYYTDKLYRDDAPFEVTANLKGARGQYSNDLMQAAALDFISAHRARPFFLYAAYTIPHAILTVPEDSLREYDGAFPDDPPLGNERKRVPRPRQTYAAMITRLDRYVGEIMARLRELGLDEQTIVFFCSDNGATSKGSLGEFFGSNRPFQGWKGSLNEGGLRAPMIVRWPGRVAAGTVDDTPWAGWDVLPTLAELAGATMLPPDLDGLSMAGALQGRVAPTRSHLYWEIPNRNALVQAVRLGDLKALRESAKAPIAVYDVRRDPAESRDLAASHPEIVARARELFRSARVPSPSYPTESP